MTFGMSSDSSCDEDIADNRRSASDNGARADVPRDKVLDEMRAFEI